MIRGLCLASAALLLATPAARAKSDLAPGNYILYYATNAANEEAMALLKVEHKGGKDVAELVDAQGMELRDFAVDGKKVSFVLDAFGRKLAFDGTVSAKDPKAAVGTFGDDRLITRGRLDPTEKEKLEQADRFKTTKLPETLQKAQKLTNEVQRLRSQVRQAQGDEAKAEMKKKLEAAQKEADEQAPALYREVLEKHADEPAVVDAALAALANAEKSGTKSDEVAKWLKAVDAFAAVYGPRYQLEAVARCLDALASQKGYEAVALESADALAKALPESASPARQSRILKTVRVAQVKAGKADLAKQTEARLARVEEAMDKEYLALVPPFKPAKFQGRKEKSERVAVMELFTGAQCPPCVAADVAFDALLKSYAPTDVVFLQYHMHIPGPDPLTNEDGEARWKYYGNLRGTPSTLFNGKTGAGGGGGMGQAEGKFKAYKGVLDPLLEAEAPLSITGKATRQGDTVGIAVDVAGAKGSADKKLRLRIALVEETVKYVGGNGLRFHHHVVRAMPGGAEGAAITEEKLAKKTEINLADLRKALAKYLDESAKEREFPTPDRPMDLRKLRVVAFVQDDATKEILQAVQLDVPDGK
jgi:hypothetical protein